LRRVRVAPRKPKFAATESFGHFSVKEKDEASPLRERGMGFVNAFILRFAGGEGFLFASLNRPILTI